MSRSLPPLNPVSFPILAVVAFFATSFIANPCQAQPRQVADKEVKSCHFIGPVSGDSGYGKKSDWQSFARDAALKRAVSLGASDVVWDRFTPVGSFNGLVVGRAYVCDQFRNKVAEQDENPSTNPNLVKN